MGFVWGIAGVVGILAWAIFRLSPFVVELLAYPLDPLQLAVLVVFSVYMAYAEGYKGFHRAFAPRVVLRADYLRHHSRPWLALLAPLFCMGYFHATRRRKIASFALTAAIVTLVLLVRLLPQPWRGIVDAGVILGLGLGVASIAWFTAGLLTRSWRPTLSPDLPEQSASVQGG